MSQRLTPLLLLSLAAVGCPSNNTTDGGGGNDSQVTDTGGGSDTQSPTDSGGNDATTMDSPATEAGMAGGRVPIYQYGYDLQRTSANRQETQLTVAALMGGGFARDTAFMPNLDGDVYTQPLYVPNLTVMGATHNVLYVATQANTIFALDAATGSTLWMTNLGTPVQLSSQPCGNINPQTGVLGGPVIDPATNTLYAVAYTNPSGNTHTFTINALDLTTGAQRTGYPAPIAPPASGSATWSPTAQQQRGALTFVNGRLYVPFGGLWGDCGNYHGWVVGIDPRNPTSQTSWATQGRGSAVWAPAGISSDGTYLYAATGNDFLTTTTGVNSNWVLRLSAGATGPTLATGTAEYFQPSNYVALDRGDVDLGSMAPIVLPDHTGSSTPHLLFEGGKQGVVYLINRDNMGGRGTGNGTTGEAVFSQQISQRGIFGAFATWSDGTNVYVFSPVGGTRPTCTAGGTGGVIALRLALTGGASTLSTAFCTASFADGTPAVSSNGNADGVLWVSQGGSGNLRAYRISDGMQVVNVTDASPIRKWVPPLVVDGRVFVTGTDTVSMYRLMR